MKMKFVFLAIVVHLGHANGDPFKMLLLHTNDMHAHFDEVESWYSSSCRDEFKEKGLCFGGFARVKEAANVAKEEASRMNVPSIFLDAGDNFQGTSYYTLYKWRIVASLIDYLEFDAMCLGNHDFDGGTGDLAEFLNTIHTPVVTANIDKMSEERLKNVSNLKPWITKDIGGRKIAIIGYVTPTTMKTSSSGSLQIQDEIPALKAEVQRLKRLEPDVNIIIGLGHSGFEMDQEIAKKVPGLSLIVGGHSHSFLHTPREEQPSTEEVEGSYPFFVTQEDTGRRVPIVQAYAFTKYLGKLWVTFDDNGAVISAEGNPQKLDNSVGKDEKVEKAVQEWVKLCAENLQIVKGYTRVFLRRSKFSSPELFESAAGNLITDAFQYVGIEDAKRRSLSYWTDSPIALYTNGGIRGKVDHTKHAGALTVEEILTIVPFENVLFACRFRGSTLKAAFEQSVYPFDAEKDDNFLRHYFCHSGLKVVYDFSQPPGSRVESISVLCSDCSIPTYEPLKDEEIYSVIMSTYLMEGGDEFAMFVTERISARSLDTTDTDAVMNFVERQYIVYPMIEGRIQVKNLSHRHRQSVATGPHDGILRFIFSKLLFLVNKLNLRKN